MAGYRVKLPLPWLRSLVVGMLIFTFMLLLLEGQYWRRLVAGTFHKALLFRKQ
jgi:hypothetical protein